jgi:uncharacterized protein YndB with AHSA1/START domain
MAAGKDDSADTADREIVITRLLNAPRELVFEAWTDPQHLTQWYGPTGFTTTFQSMDLRVGGVCLFVMHGPDGVDYDNRMDFLEVVKPEKLVYLYGSRQDDPDQFHVTVTFAEERGKTRLTMRSLCKTAAARDKEVKEHGAIEGGNQTVDRLEAHLVQMRAGK